MAVTIVTTASGGWTIEGINMDAGILDLNGVANSVVLDQDGDTHISAPIDDQIDFAIAGSDDFTMTANAFNVLSGSAVTGASGTFVPFMPVAAQQALSGAGAAALTSYYTAWTTTSTDALTLADGVMKGQLKKIQMIVDGGDGTLTPTNLTSGTNITFADAGDYAVLVWDGAGWEAIELGNSVDGITAPVVA